ncbi:conserved hypothetical protein [Gammaproteobacteria bacterium]
MERLYQIPAESCDVIELQKFWTRVAGDQMASGMGAERFCQQHQINFSKFHYWKYRKVKPNSSHDSGISNPKDRQDDKDVAKFISLQVAVDKSSNECQEERITANHEDRAVEIVFKNGHKIILPLVISEANLSLLIKTVGGLQC